MGSCLQLPYFRKDNLPAPLPSIHEIQASTHFLKGSEDLADQKVVRVGNHFVVKIRPIHNTIEGENLLFIEQNLQISAPKLYAMWKETDEKLYIVMEYIPGNSLEALWPELEAQEKACILSKVRAMLDQMRALPSPGFFGSVTKTYLPFDLFYWPGRPVEICGPFQNERELIKGLVDKSRRTADMNERYPYEADFFENELLRDLVKSERASTFTHADLQRKNIQVQELDLPDTDNKDFVVSILDWESAGWYPCYWEYFSAFLAFVWDNDWPTQVVQAVDAWPAETAMMKLIHQHLWL